MLPPAIEPEIINSLRELDPDGDGFFQEVVTTYLSNTAGQLEALRSAVAGGDVPLVERSAHKLKGGCAAIGANRLARLCSIIEQNARGGDIGDVEASLPEIIAEFERGRLELESMLAS